MTHQQLHDALLAEVKAAHIIIKNALNLMTSDQKREWGRQNDAGGLVEFGSTRANERAVAIAAAENVALSQPLRARQIRQAEAVVSSKSEEYARLSLVADAVIDAYKEHYDFPPQSESHMHDCIMEELDIRNAAPVAAQQGQLPAVGDGMAVLPFAVLDALRFYANGHHFNLADRNAWDTVSGEPQNFWCDEAGTATVEDGSIAKAVLQGVAFTDGDVAEPVKGEVYIATPAPIASPAALTSDAVVDATHRIARLLLGDVRKVDCDIIESHIRALLASQPSEAREGLDFVPNAQHAVADMANIGYSLMQAIKTHRPGYAWNDSPAEIVGDLVDEIEAATQQPREARDAERWRNYPAEMTPALRDALETMLWTSGQVSRALRVGGAEIKKRAEDEQAYVLHWFIQLALEHGDEWRKRAGEQLQEMAALASQREGGAA